MDLVDRGVYELRSRNLVLGAYREETRGFIGIREKFGDHYLFEEYDRATGGLLGTATATRFTGILVPEDILLAERGEPEVVCSECRREVGWTAYDDGRSGGWWLHAEDATTCWEMGGQDNCGVPVGVANTALLDFLAALEKVIGKEVVN